MAVCGRWPAALLPLATARWRHLDAATSHSGSGCLAAQLAAALGAQDTCERPVIGSRMISVSEAPAQRPVSWQRSRSSLQVIETSSLLCMHTHACSCKQLHLKAATTKRQRCAVSWLTLQRPVLLRARLMRSCCRGCRGKQRHVGLRVSC